MSLEKAQEALDKVIRLGRVHLYKPIQIAEILHHHRTVGRLELTELEQYRNQSKKWRDEVSLLLVGRVSTSSARYQDDLFNDNAMPPHLLAELGKENLAKDGAIEAYIYSCFKNKQEQLLNAITYVRNSTPATFDISKFLKMFRKQQGLRRSIDKVYEAVVYALFNTLVHAINAKITLTVDAKKSFLLKEFEAFTRVVLGVDATSLTYTTKAALYRVGVTNAADRGLDMWANFGPAIQIKHLTLDVDLAENIVGNIEADKIVIVCRDFEKDSLSAVFKQIGWANRVQGIIVESELVKWYSKALTGKYSEKLADKLLVGLLNELETEFPSSKNFITFFLSRGYNKFIEPGFTNEDKLC